MLVHITGPDQSSPCSLRNDSTMVKAYLSRVAQRNVEFVNDPHSQKHTGRAVFQTNGRPTSNRRRETASPWPPTGGRRHLQIPQPCALHTVVRQSDGFPQKVFHPHRRLLTARRPLRGRICFGCVESFRTSTYVLEQIIHQAPERGIRFCQFSHVRVHPVHCRQQMLPLTSRFRTSKRQQAVDACRIMPQSRGRIQLPAPVCFRGILDTLFR